MKQFTKIMKVSAAIGLLASVVGKANASLLLDEEFNYPDGALTNVSGGAWVGFSGTTARRRSASATVGFGDGDFVSHRSGRRCGWWHNGPPGLRAPTACGGGCR